MEDNSSINQPNQEIKTKQKKFAYRENEEPAEKVEDKAKKNISKLFDLNEIKSQMKIFSDAYDHIRLNKENYPEYEKIEKYDKVILFSKFTSLGCFFSIGYKAIKLQKHSYGGLISFPISVGILMYFLYLKSNLFNKLIKDYLNENEKKDHVENDPKNN